MFTAARGDWVGPVAAGVAWGAGVVGRDGADGFGISAQPARTALTARPSASLGHMRLVLHPVVRAAPFNICRSIITFLTFAERPARAFAVNLSVNWQSHQPRVQFLSEGLRNFTCVEANAGHVTCLSRLPLFISKPAAYA